MKFGPVAVSNAHGAILAHSVRVGTTRFRKGMQLNSKAITALREAGILEVSVALLEAGDVPEDEAATALAAHFVPDAREASIRIDASFTGRVNLFAERVGVLRFSEPAVHAINAVDPDITLATLPDYRRVAAGELLATIKIIPYAVRDEILERVSSACRPEFKVHGFKPIKAALILTRTDAISQKALTKGKEVTHRRLEAMGVALTSVETVDHTCEAVASALKHADAELLLILGASATSDLQDVCPMGVVIAGGEITRFGMPVDPGNLLFLGELQGSQVIGLPGCARSPAMNGADWVLERVVSGLEVTGSDIARMGVGGLLKEIPIRPQPRAFNTRKSGDAHIEIILLAAGNSSRMAGEDKLLKHISGEPLLRRSAMAALASGANKVRVVLPENASARAETLAGLDLAVVEARDAAEGMAASLRAGLAATSGKTDAVIVALADMPDVEPHHYDALIEGFSAETGREICRAVTQSGSKGHPVLFGRRFFENLAALQGDQGAREIVSAASEFVVDIKTTGQGAVIDLDTREAWAAYLDPDQVISR